MKFLAVLDYDYFGNDYIKTAKIVAPYAEIIWFRIKNLPHEKIFSLAKKLRQLLPDSKLILSENAVIAKEAGFNGVHLNSGNDSPQKVKAAHPDLIVGYSAHSINECVSIESDYKTLSPIFPTNKPFKKAPLGLIKAPCANIYALGGITLENYTLIANNGFEGVAGIRLCLDADKLL